MRRFGLIFLALLLTGCAATSPSSTPTPSAPGAPRPIVAFGDSYTEGHGTTRDKAYPAIMGAALGRAIDNQGVTGETAGEALPRLQKQVIDRKPELVIVEFGVNEAYRGYPVERSLNDLDTMLARIQPTGAKLILVGVHFWGFQENFDEGLRALSTKYHTGLVLDVLHGIVSSSQSRDDGDAKLRSDAFHPNAAGYAVMAQRIEPEVRRILAASS